MKLFKKGGEGIPWWATLMIISGIFIVVWFFISNPVFGGFSETSTRFLVEEKLENCKLKGDRGQLDGTPYPDEDEDGLPDYCDNCPNIPNFDWSIVKDEDGDNFPTMIDESKKCCARNVEEDKIKEDEDDYCETQKNDIIYGPKKLILAYIK